MPLVDGEPRAQRLAVDNGHYIEQKSAGVARVEQREDVRVLELRRRLDLAEEAVGAQGRCEIGVENLDGDVALVAKVLREVDRGHSARAELAVDGVSAGKGGVELVEGVHGAEKVSSWRRVRQRRTLEVCGGRARLGACAGRARTASSFGAYGQCCRYCRQHCHQLACGRRGPS